LELSHFQEDGRNLVRSRDAIEVNESDTTDTRGIMKLAIASGKGGTGKTTVATSMVLSIDDPVVLLDCDVEEPNCHLFLHPEIDAIEKVCMAIPKVHEEYCTGCGECSQICQFGAIVMIRSQPLVFPELCHGCGGCALICPEKAITEINRSIGILRQGTSEGVQFVQGCLNIGEVQSPELIRAVKQNTGNEQITIIDAPPGTSCPVIETVKDCDYVILVTEPTPFGLHDLKLAVAMVRQLNIPFGVVTNRATIGDNKVQEYCDLEGIPILMKIPEDRRIAEAYSKGIPAIRALPTYKTRFAELFVQCFKEAEL